MLAEFVVMCQKMYGDKAKAIRFMPLTVLTQAPVNTAGVLLDADELETPNKYGFNDTMIRVCGDPDSGVYLDGDNMVAWILYRDEPRSLIEPNNVESFKQVCFSSLVIHLSSLVSVKISEPLQYGTVSRNINRYWIAFEYYLLTCPELEMPDLSDPIGNAETITKFIQAFCAMAERELRENIAGKSGIVAVDTTDIPDDVSKIEDKFGKKYAVQLNPLQQQLMDEMMQGYNKSAECDSATIVDSSDKMIPTEIRVKMLDIIEHFEIEEDITNTEFGTNNQLSKECPECHSDYIIYSGLGQKTCMECDHTWNVVIDALEITPDMKAEYEEKMRQRKEQTEDHHQSRNPKSVKRIKEDNDT